MLEQTVGVNGLQRLRAQVVRWFFFNFFRLLLLAVSVSEWCVLWWVFPTVIRPLPLAAQVSAGALLYAINRASANRTQRRRRMRVPVAGMPRLYYAVAFTSLFCTLFLLLTGAVWSGARLLVGSIAVEARTAHVAALVHSDVDVLFRWIANTGMALIALGFAYGYTVGQQRLRVRRFALSLRDYPRELSGVRIVHISDTHIGQNLEQHQLRRFVACVNQLEPDLVCITGDIIDAPSADVESFVPILAELRATYGVFAILGNHDHYAGADRVEHVLRTMTSFTVLRDQQTAIEVNGRRLHVIGLDDRGRDWARGVSRVAYLEQALSKVPADEPVLLLCHRPDVFPHAAARRIGLTLSGHTHGGQIGVPWTNGRVRNLAEFITKFDRGLFERDGCYLYVSCGLGVTGQRIRLNTPREITVIEVEESAATRAAA